ncbi:hypothetical protein C8F04DRAFT_389575 [Mycena alexandri]|uniref:HMG box domain-containing protein n=1 Tax=Mycena alexandri TaxID=1745969 RepID=A0AAD6X3V6_9AGAR|nr:hypothetical protein C8F04DRAFT_389575 [Mycena alexandri]
MMNLLAPVLPPQLESELDTAPPLFNVHILPDVGESGHIPHPRNTFICFRSDYVKAQKIAAARPGSLDQTAMSCGAGDAWRKMSEEPYVFEEKGPTPSSTPIADTRRGAQVESRGSTGSQRRLGFGGRRPPHPTRLMRIRGPRSPKRLPRRNTRPIPLRRAGNLTPLYPHRNRASHILHPHPYTSFQLLQLFHSLHSTTTPRTKLSSRSTGAQSAHRRTTACAPTLDSSETCRRRSSNL